MFEKQSEDFREPSAGPAPQPFAAPETWDQPFGFAPNFSHKSPVWVGGTSQADTGTILLGSSSGWQPQLPAPLEKPHFRSKPEV